LGQTLFWAQLFFCCSVFLISACTPSIAVRTPSEFLNWALSPSA
jgi:hypothetical protein